MSSTSTSAPTPSAAATGDHVPSAWPISIMRGRNTPDGFSMCSPSRSRTCVLAMSSAMPFVNPTTTDRGRKRTAAPSPVRPIITSARPASNVHMYSPSSPCLAMMPEITTTNAPVGPPICTREPPRAETTKPATMAV